MTFELHVWSPAFLLPTIDPQCLAAIAYLSYISQQTNTQCHWHIVASSDPAVSPTRELPALKDTSAATTIGGLQNIIDYLRTQHLSWDLDRDLENDPAKAADQTAFTSHITSRGNILLALSLFVSTENYTTITRPTYSSILSWPTQYIIPPTLRSKARQLTAHLGLSSPDLDNNDDPQSNSITSNRHKSIIPDSLRTLGMSDNRSHPKSLTETLAHQKTSTRFRLEALIDDFCDPLSSLLATQENQTQTPYLLSSTHPSSLDAIASAYLNLMLQPPLPQDWLRSRIQTRWPRLVEYAQRTGLQFWGTGRNDFAAANETSPSTPTLPWAAPTQQNVISRTLSTVLTAYFPSSAITSTASIPAPITAATDTSGDDKTPPPSQPASQDQPYAHSLPTILLASTAFTATVAAISSYVVMPYLGPSAGEAKENRRNLNELGEAGAMLQSVIEVEPPGGGGGGGVVGSGVKEEGVLGL